jgi:hypothetical protein
MATTSPVPLIFAMERIENTASNSSSIVTHRISELLSSDGPRVSWCGSVFTGRCLTTAVSSSFHVTVSIFMLSYPLYLDLPRCPIPSVFRSKLLYAFFFSSMDATCTAHLIFLDMIMLICGENPQCAIICNVLLATPSQVRIFTKGPIERHPQT